VESITIDERRDVSVEGLIDVNERHTFLPRHQFQRVVVLDDQAGAPVTRNAARPAAGRAKGVLRRQRPDKDAQPAPLRRANHRGDVERSRQDDRRIPSEVVRALEKKQHLRLVCEGDLAWQPDDTG